MSQVALFSLTSITAPGNISPGQYTITINAGGEITTLTSMLTPGLPVTFADHLKGLDPPPFGSMSLPVNVQISGGNPMAPTSGSASLTYSIPPAPPTQQYSMTVMLSGPAGSSSVSVSFQVDFRDYPVSYDPDWLCRNRYNYSNFYRWLCLGVAQINNFVGIAEVATLQATINTQLPRLERVATAIGASPAPTGQTLLETSQYVTDITMAAMATMSTLTWAQRYTIEDFTSPYEEAFENVVAVSYLVIDPQIMDLCKRWRDLLDCFCRFCARRPSLPSDVTTYYDGNIAADVNSLFPQIQGIAVGEGMPGWISPAPSSDCDRLSYIVSFWAWWCRVCGASRLTLPPWAATIEPWYTRLYDKRQLLSDVMEGESLTLCRPPEKDYCKRWLDLLDCLKKLCDKWATLPGSLQNALYTALNAQLASAYTFLNMRPPVGQLNHDISQLCQMVQTLDGYFTFLCTKALFPWSHNRRTQLDNLLVGLESSMTGVKATYGDICADTVPMTDCSTWNSLLGCLSRICSEKAILTDDLRTTVLNKLGAAVDAIYHSVPGRSDPAELDDIALFCLKVSTIQSDITTYCANGVDPILLITLKTLLQQLQSAVDALQAAYPNLCSTSTSIPSGWCDNWLPKLRCLKKYCGQRTILPQDVIDDFVDDLGAIIDQLDWLLNDGSNLYAPPATTPSFAMLCAKLSAILSRLRSLCEHGSIDPILLAALNALMDAFADAYAAFNNAHPELCSNVNTLCEDWIVVLDCIVSHHDRYYTDVTNPTYAETVNAINTGVGTLVEGTYTTVTTDPALAGMAQGIDRWAYIHRSLLDWFATHCACCDSMDSGTVSYLQAQMDQVQDVYDGLPFCGTSCTIPQLTLATGTAPWVMTTVDDQVKNPAQATVTVTSGTSRPVIGSSHWISLNASASDSHIGITMFERCFCLCRASDVRITFTYFADDYADIYVDGTLVHSVAPQIMVNNETFDIALYLGPGRHCLRAEVHNLYATNMFFGGDGSISCATGSLMSDSCCNAGTTVSDPCAAFDADCDKLTMIPRMYRMLCCVDIPVGDSIWSTSAMIQLQASLSCIEQLTPRLQLETGIGASVLPGTGPSLCERLRVMFGFAMVVYSGSRRVSPYVRRSLDCFITRVCASLATLAPQLAEKPVACAASCVDCDRWFALFVCLCKLCKLRRPASGNDPGTLTQFDAVICDDIMAIYQTLAAASTSPYTSAIPMSAAGSPPTDCCELLRRSTVFLGLACMYGLSIPSAQRTQLEAQYVQLRGEYDRLRTQLGATFTGTCTDTCPSWIWRLECLYVAALRFGELSSTLRASFTSLFSSRITALFNAITPAPAGAGAPSSSLASGDAYKLFEVLRTLHLTCGPCRTMPSGVATLLNSGLATFIADYATWTAQLAAAGVVFCAESVDICAHLHGLVGYSDLLCGVDPPSGAPAVIALEDIFTRTQQEIASLARNLRLTQTMLPGGAFCNRLEFVVDLLATAFSRYQELAPQARVVVDYLDAQLAAQSAAYAATIANDLPRPETAMTAFRHDWLELLECICKACAMVGGMSAQERAGATDLVNLVEGNPSDLRTAIDALYALVIPKAVLLGLPIADDPCATTTCMRARVAISFFTAYCLRCSSPDAAVVAYFAPVLDQLRQATVLLRSKLYAVGRNVCGEEDTQAYTIQSQFLYLQAVGSDGFNNGGDGSAGGVHLRWAFLNDLGNRHLPKGPYTRPGSPYFASYGYNKPDDYVAIYRTRYVDTDTTKYFPATIDLSATTQQRPTDVSQDGGVWTWTYTNVQVDRQLFPSAVVTLTLRFVDDGSYRTLRQNNTPTDPKNVGADVAYIVANFTGTVEVETDLNLMFAFELTSPSLAAMTTRVEAISLNEDPSAAAAPLFISARRRFVGNGTRHKVMSEAVQYFRFRYSGGAPGALLVETYADFYTATHRRYLWKKIGNYALTLDTTEAARRLEDTTRFNVDGAWPKYGHTLEGQAPRVKVVNYLDRWLPNRHYLPDGHADPTYDPSRPAFERDPKQSIRTAVESYLQRSVDPAQVEAWLTQAPVLSTDSGSINISALRMLLLAAQDYHVARMLGLGMIDPDVPLAGDAAGQRYIYMAEYVTPADPAKRITAMTHRYLSLPTGRSDVRLPAPVTIASIEPLVHEDFTDSQGYTRYADARYLNVNRGTVAIDLPVGDFFADTTEFSHGTATKPMQFGIRITKPDGTSPSDWRQVYPVNDFGEYEPSGYVPYADQDGHPELHGIPDTGNPVFVHRIENLPGNDFARRYGIFGINWFSRASAIGVYSNTITTSFPKYNSLLPPANLAVQYIQREVPPVLTSLSEQAQIATHGKRTRVLFDWNHVHNIAYQSADRVQFFFRTDAPVSIRGVVKNPQSISGNGDVYVEADAYPDLTADPSKGSITVEPIVTSSQISQQVFVGSIFATSTHRFIVVEVTAAGNNYARFHLTPMETTDENGVKKTEAYDPPKAGTTFMVVENLANTARWRALPSSVIQLADFTRLPYPQVPVYTEQLVENGQSRTLTVGGLFEPAARLERVDTITVPPGSPAIDAPPGVYKITCPTIMLFDYNVQYPNNPWFVEFYRGTVRVPDPAASGRMKAVQVIKFLVDQGKFTIYVFDPSDTIGPHTGFATVPMNFHPSYRGYIDLLAGGIPESDIMPTGDAPTRQTYIAAYSMDSPRGYTSSLTPAAVQIAHNVADPVKPLALSGPAYATRPDFYGKSSCSVDMPVAANRTPYGAVFYRGDEEAVLRALYKQDTIDNVIRPHLNSVAHDDAYISQWRELVTGVVDTTGPNARRFKVYNGFAFPVPDNPDAELFDPVHLADPDDPAHPTPYRKAFVPSRLPGDPAQGLIPSALDDIREVIAGAMVPLTERPILTSLVDVDDALVTSSQKPVVRDANGELLTAEDPGFNPYPMVRRTASGTTIRFTDYALDGASRNIFFYCAREISNTLAVGPVSDILGPVRLVNAAPSAAPAIRHVIVAEAQQGFGLQQSVNFTVTPYPDAEGITAIRLYRALTAADATSTRTMTLVGTFDVATLAQTLEGWIVRDLFADIDPPFGSPIFYRLAGVRPLSYLHLGQMRNEEIESLPSEIVLVNVVDSANPVPPAIDATYDAYHDPLQNNALTEYRNVVLTWYATSVQSTYALYKMQSNGNWKLVAAPTTAPTMLYNAGTLPKLVDGAVVYHRYKVVVTNSYGLRNLDDVIFTL
ncbi:MAG TPA: hypothetical protein VHI13_17920 [Candidatus Kapabacteria bacterium]|nr:hypothetical protein [Candidatus Kapabacteria bacterium]